MLDLFSTPILTFPLKGEGIKMQPIKRR